MLYIPQEFMVGFQRRVNHKGMLIDTDRDNEYVLGFATYKDEKGKIRCETSWKGWKHDENPVLTFPNAPVPGFKIAGTETRGTGGWNSTGRSVFDVEDPRGFILQINSGNLIQILNQCDLEKGVIQNKCLWSWEGKNLILVPEGTDLYKEGVESFRLKGKKVSIKDIEIGDEITLQDGTHGMWLGGQYTVNENAYSYYHRRDESHPGQKEFTIGQPKRKLFFLEYDRQGRGETVEKYLHEKTTFKVAEITKRAEKSMTPEEVSTLLNKHSKFYNDLYKKNEDIPWKDRDNSKLDGWDYDWDFKYHIYFSPKKPQDSVLLNMFAQDDKHVSMWDKDIAEEKDREFYDAQRRDRRW